MTWYSKYLIIASIIGIVGIPIFTMDANDLSWSANKESYWGIISLFAIIITVFFEYKSRKAQKN